MSEINSSINNVENNLNSTIDTQQPIENNTKKRDSPVLSTVNNIINIISNILKILHKKNYTKDDEETVYKCLFNIQSKLKIPNISDNIENSFIDVKNTMENLPKSKLISISGDLYTFNNCLITFNAKLHQPLSPNDEKFNQPKLNNSFTIYQKSLLYVLILCILVYFFNH